MARWRDEKSIITGYESPLTRRLQELGAEAALGRRDVQEIGHGGDRSCPPPTYTGRESWRAT